MLGGTVALKGTDRQGGIAGGVGEGGRLEGPASK